MREFTPEEKELIINTPITRDCLDIDYEKLPLIEKELTDRICEHLESFREAVKCARKNSRRRNETFDLLCRLLPNSYKVINLTGTPDLEKLTNGVIQRTG